MKKIISCSRRTDIPSFYYDWLQKVLEEKIVTLKNPYNDKDFSVDLDPENVHSLILWSKDFKNVVDNPLHLDKYNLYFQYTITGRGMTAFEPSVPLYKESFKTMKSLADRYGGGAVNWRFDPIFIEEKRTAKDGAKNLVRVFKKLADMAVDAGVNRCTISFMDFYDKVTKRLHYNNLKVYDIDDALKVEIAQGIIDASNERGIKLCLCAQKINSELTGYEDVGCIDGAVLMDLYGGKTTKSKDGGQRKLCKCVKSSDIGSYLNQPCGFKCKYCYAND